MIQISSNSAFFESFNASKTNSNICLWALPSKRSKFLPTANTQAIEDKATTLAKEHDVYCSIALFQNPPAGGRGKIEDASHLIGFFADIDTLEKPDPKGRKYAPTKEAALKALSYMPVKPTYVMDSGYGLHALWLFNEPLAIKDAKHREELKVIYSDFQNFLKNIFLMSDYELDSGIGDLVRVFRVPNTFNRKYKSNTKPVTILESNPSNRVTAEQIKVLVGGATKQVKTTAKKNASKSKTDADASLIKQECAWFNHFVDDAVQLTEYEWYAGLSIIGHCKDGQKLAHEYSQSYAGYSRAETDKKLEQAISTAGPRSCENIRTSCGGEGYCSKCPHFGNITSPIQLGYPENEGNTIKDKIYALVKDLEYWHTKNDTAYVTITENSHKENLLLKGKRFGKWLKRKSRNAEGKLVSKQQIEEVIDLLEANAIFDGKECQAFTRVAYQNGNLYIDRGTKDWSVFEITPEGWHIKPEAPVKFIRSDSFQALPEPDRNGDIYLLRKYIPCDDNDFKLILGFVLGISAPRKPYPIGIFTGLYGCGKTTRARAIIRLTDPSETEMINAPRESRDVLSSAASRWLSSIDNVKKIDQSISDTFCSISTGISHAARQYHTNLEVFETPEIARPQIITGIELRLNQDLRSRAIKFEFAPMTATECKTEDEYWEEFNSDAPKILGGILNAISCALRNWDKVKKQKVELPRLADHAQWVSAAEDYLGWEEGTYRKLLLEHQKQGTLESDMNAVFSEALYKYFKSKIILYKEPMHFTVTQLYEELKSWIKKNPMQKDDIKYIPHTVKSFAQKLKNTVLLFQIYGVEIEYPVNYKSNKRAVKVTFSDDFREIVKDDEEPIDDGCAF